MIDIHIRWPLVMHRMCCKNSFSFKKLAFFLLRASHSLQENRPADSKWPKAGPDPGEPLVQQSSSRLPACEGCSLAGGRAISCSLPDPSSLDFPFVTPLAIADSSCASFSWWMKFFSLAGLSNSLIAALPLADTGLELHCRKRAPSFCSHSFDQ